MAQPRWGENDAFQLPLKKAAMTTRSRPTNTDAPSPIDSLVEAIAGRLVTLLMGARGRRCCVTDESVWLPGWSKHERANDAERVAPVCQFAGPGQFVVGKSFQDAQFNMTMPTKDKPFTAFLSLAAAY